MMGEDQFRNKIYWFTFFFSLLVIWVHSANAEIYLGQMEEGWLLFAVEDFVGNVVAQISVPGFFMISSYLFYRNFSMSRLKDKWSSRIRTILVPFILWNFLYYMGYVAASRIPGLRDVVGKGTIPFDLMTAADAILHYTYNYVFWYLYQLILLILLAPAIYMAVKNRILAAAAAVVLLVSIAQGYRLSYLNLDALLYYGTAAYFAVHMKNGAERAWNRRRLAAGLGFIAFAALCQILSVEGQRVLFVVLFRLFLPLGLWMAVDEAWLPTAPKWMKDTFFLYAVHFAIVRLINKTGAVVAYGIPWVPAVLYLIMPALCVAASAAIAAPMKKWCPALWSLLTGGRTA